MGDVVSDVEIRQSLSEMRFRLPAAGEYLKAVRRGRLSLRDALYFTLLSSQEEARRRQPVACGCSGRLSLVE